MVLTKKTPNTLTCARPCSTYYVSLPYHFILGVVLWRKCYYSHFYDSDAKAKGLQLTGGGVASEACVLSGWPIMLPIFIPLTRRRAWKQLLKWSFGFRALPTPSSQSLKWDLEAEQRRPSWGFRLFPGSSQWSHGPSDQPTQWASPLQSLQGRKKY